MFNAKYLNSSHVTNASSSDSFKQLMSQLVYLKIFLSKTGIKALIQFSNFIRWTSFDLNKQRVDDFYFRFLKNRSEHNEFCYVLKLIFTVSHGRANVERGFSSSKNLLNQNMEALTITSRRQLKDHLISNKIILREFKVPSTLLQNAQSAQRKYKICLKTTRSEKEKDRKSKQKEVIDQVIKDTEAWSQEADKTIKSLEQEFVTSANNGKKGNDMSLISKTMAMKRKSTEKQIEL